MGNTTLIRPDGSKLTVPDSDAAPLVSLGYKPETSRGELESGIQQGEENYYTQPMQKVGTAVEGGLSGLTFGASNEVFDSEESRARAQYNPGIRLGSELLGGLLVPVPGAEAVGEGAAVLSESKTLRGLAKGAYEGAAYGGAATLSNVKMSGDPVTAEAILGGMGWGAVFGGGLGALAGKGESLLEGRAARKAAEEATGKAGAGAEEGAIADRAQGDAKIHNVLAEDFNEKAAATKSLEASHYGEFHASIEDARGQIKTTMDTLKAETENMVKPNLDALKKSKSEMYNWIVSAGKDSGIKDVRSSARAAEASFQKALDASKAGDYKALTRHLEAFEEHVQVLQDHFVPPEEGHDLGQMAKDAHYTSNLKTAKGFENDGQYAENLKTTEDLSKKMTGPYAENLKVTEGFANQPEGMGGLAKEAQYTANMKVAKGYENPEEVARLEGKQLKRDNMKVASSYGPSGFNPFPGEPALDQARQVMMQSRSRFQAAIKAAEATKAIGNIGEHLQGLPKTAEEFRGMTSAKVEKLSGAVDALMKVKVGEFAGLKGGVADALEKLQERLGVKIEGTPGEQLRGLHLALKESGSSAAREAAKNASEGAILWRKAAKTEEHANEVRAAGSAPKGKGTPEKGLLHRSLEFAGGMAGEEAAKRLGATGMERYVAYRGAKYAVSSLLGLKGAVLGHIGSLVDKWGPKAVSALKFAGPRVPALTIRLDGTLESERKTKVQLMQDRAKEIRDAAPVVRDILYKHIAPLGTEHPELASAMHELAASQFAYILDKLPKDPGGAFNAFKTLWKPDEVACLKFERCYEVFQDPVGAIHRAMVSGKVTPELAEGLREMNPGLYSEFRAQMLQRISDPQVWSKITYPEQVNIGVLLGLPVHSTMRPHFISAQMQMYTERSQKLGINPQTGSGNGPSGGRPSGPATSPGATASQKVTEH